ncbi:MAG TPA: hypothetical protein VEB70_00095 [Noviherbaspirillum sp.]|nr:hypothetical protein [Noviherbaspirillum sp.]
MYLLFRLTAAATLLCMKGRKNSEINMIQERSISHLLIGTWGKTGFFSRKLQSPQTNIGLRTRLQKIMHLPRGAPHAFLLEVNIVDTWAARMGSLRFTPLSR